MYRKSKDSVGKPTKCSLSLFRVILPVINEKFEKNDVTVLEIGKPVSLNTRHRGRFSRCQVLKYDLKFMKMASKVSPKAGKWGFQSIFGRGSTPNFGKKSCQIVPRQIHEIFFGRGLAIQNKSSDTKQK